MTLHTLQYIFLTTSLALVLARPLMSLARRTGFIDLPGSLPHKRHDRPIPLAGGWIVSSSVLVGCIFAGLYRNQVILSLVGASLIVFAFGIWDDRKSLPASVKLLGQLAAASVLVVSGSRVQLFEPSLSWLNLSITFIWMVGITNAYNFVDSMDGLATGLAALAGAFFILVTADAGQHDYSLFSAILVGALVGTYYFNAQPARVFLGDSGSQWLGFIIAGLAIAYNPQGYLRIQSWFLPILLVGVPIFDTCLVVFSRLRRKNPLFRAGFDHTYHRLVELGLDSNRAVLLMQFAALLLGCLAFITLALPPLWGNLIFAACLTLGAVGIIRLGHPVRKN